MYGRKKLGENVIRIKITTNSRYTWIVWSDGSEVSRSFVTGGD